MIDDQRAPGFEPHLALQICVDLRLQSHLFEEGLEAVVFFDLGLRIGDELFDEFLDALVGLGVIDHDPLGLRTGRVANDPQGQIGLGMQDGGGLFFGVGELDGFPDGLEIPDIGLEVGFAYAVASGPNDETEILGAQAVDDLAQPLSLAIGIDAARNPDPGRPGREDQMTAGDRNIRCDPGALGPNGGLGNLDHDFLTFGQDRVDARGRGSASAPSLASTAARSRLLFSADVVEVVTDVEEGGFFEADIDEGGLHAGKHPADPAFDHIAHHALTALAFDVEFGKYGLFEQRDPGFARVDVDNDFVLHWVGCSLEQPRTDSAGREARVRSSSASPARFSGVGERSQDVSEINLR